MRRFTLLLLVVFVVHTWAANFRHYCNVEFESVEGSYQAASLTPEILMKCKEDLSDLRLYDSVEKEIPYVIIDEAYPSEKVDRYVMKITGFEDLGSSTIVYADMPAIMPHPAVKIFFDVTQKDFRRNVVVEGSVDGKEWEIMGQGSIYDFHSQVSLRKTEVDIKKTYYKHLKFIMTDPDHTESGGSINLTYDGLFFSSSKDLGKEITVKGIRAHSYPASSGTTVYDSYEFDTFEVLQDTSKTFLMVESRLPCEQLSFNCGPGYFKRDFTLESSCKRDGPYKHVESDSIYRFPLYGKMEENSMIRVNAGKPAFLRLAIRNGDSPALDIKSLQLKWKRKLLMFSSEAKAPCKLCFGNPAVVRPVYDISTFLSQSNWHSQEVKRARLSKIVESTSYKPGLSSIEKKQREKAMLTFIIILIGAGLAYWLFSMMSAEPKKE